MNDETRPPIPMSLAGRPVRGGLVVPWVNVQLADGGADYRTAHREKSEQAWRDGRCQACGSLLEGRCVLMCGPRQLLTRRFDEPPACPPCALYASKACPMVAGRMDTYADRQAVSDGDRGKTCPDPGCDCGGWTNIDPEHTSDHGGDPAHAWYALWVIPKRWQLTGHPVRYRCFEEGCQHERIVINGALLLMEPLKVVLVSVPGEGRVWRTLTVAEAREHASCQVETQAGEAA